LKNKSNSPDLLQTSISFFLFWVNHHFSFFFSPRTQILFPPPLFFFLLPDLPSPSLRGLRCGSICQSQYRRSPRRLNRVRSVFAGFLVSVPLFFESCIFLAREAHSSVMGANPAQNLCCHQRRFPMILLFRFSFLCRGGSPFFLHPIPGKFGGRRERLFFFPPSQRASKPPFFSPSFAT